MTLINQLRTFARALAESSRREIAMKIEATFEIMPVEVPVTSLPEGAFFALAPDGQNAYGAPEIWQKFSSGCWSVSVRGWQKPLAEFAEVYQVILSF